MATGITLNNWNGEVDIISSELFSNSIEYQLAYEGKSSRDDILNDEIKSSYEIISSCDSSNLLFFGDNFDVLKYLIKLGYRNKVKLIYIDPPYATNSLFMSKHQKHSYKDDLVGSHFIEFLRKRLILLREILSDDGSIYLHLDNNMMFEAKIIMDEVFGKNNFRGLITRKKCSNKNSTKRTYGNISDYILFYSKSNNFIWHRPVSSWTDEKIIKEYPCIESDGRRYKKVPIHAPGIRNGETGKEWRGKLPPIGKHWQYTPQKLDELDRKGEIYWSSSGNPRRKVYFDNDKGIAVQDIWLDVQDSLNQNIKTTGYPTEKNPNLLERIIKSCTNPDDIVLDCFAGSGTTCGISEKLGRKWIGVDNSSEAIFSITKRLFGKLELHGDYVSRLDVFNGLLGQSQLFGTEIPFSLYTDVNYRKEIIDKVKDIIPML